MVTFLLIIVIFLVAGFIQGLSGFGSALLAMPLLTMFIDLKIAVPLCILNSLLITAYLSLKLRDHIEREKILPLLAGSLPGIFIGVTFLKNAESNILKLLLGLLIVIYCFYSLISNPAPRALHRAWAYIAGFCTGFIGSAFGAGGPPVIIYTTLTGWSRDHIKATLTGFFFSSSLITTVLFALNGLTSPLVIKYFLVSAIFVLIGVYAGLKLYDRVNRRMYIRIILITLIFLGLLMIISSM